MSDRVTFVRYFQWATMLFKLKSRLHTVTYKSWNNLSYPFASLTSYYTSSYSVLSILGPLLFLKTADTSHLCTCCLFSGMLPHIPEAYASLSHFLQNFTHVSLSFSHWFFCSVLCSWLPPCFFMLTCNLFIFTAMKYFIVWICHSPFIHSVDRYLCCFQCFPIANIPPWTQLLVQNCWIICLCIFNFDV